MHAVEVRNAYKYYGSKKSPNVILNRLSMTVNHGSIYGLMGASGCGKTTLLSCIVGSMTLNQGQVNVLGGTPNAEGSGVPGPRIGYMPQEIALVDEFSIKEIIYYFGRLYGMSTENIRIRYKKLRELLDLPPGYQLIQKCSGGQQRRVSFAVAMVHEPELLILDEPTVGLDPILREKIWDFLITTTRTSKLAVIITTHYIQEAVQADCVGLMRNGILLAEDSPSNILTHFEVQSLEDAFLQLCMKHGVSDQASDNLIQAHAASESNQLNDGYDKNSNDIQLQTVTKTKGKTVYRGELRKLTSKQRIKALLIKNFIQMIRQPAGLIFLAIVPFVQLSLFYLAIGGKPIGLKLAIVNDEIMDYRDCFNNTLISAVVKDYDCELTKVSCRFLHQLNDSIALKFYYDNFDDAYIAARKGIVMGIIHFAANFTESYEEIRDHGKNAVEGAYEGGKINIFMDQSNQQLTFYLEAKLRQAYKYFSESLMNDCQLPTKLANVPIDFKEPIYGTFDEDFKDSMAPGMVMTMTFFLGAIVTSTVFIRDRSEGIWNRTLIAGASTAELLFAAIFCLSIMIIIQTAEFVITAGIIFNTVNHGNNFTVFFLILMLGFTGMFIGMFISIYADKYNTSNIILTGISSPMIALCGIFWPLEGIPGIVRYFSMTLPFTLPSIAVRNVLARGYSITHPSVLAGYGITFLWAAGSIALCLVGLKYKKYSRNT